MNFKFYPKCFRHISYKVKNFINVLLSWELSLALLIPWKLVTGSNIRIDIFLSSYMSTYFKYITYLFLRWLVDTFYKITQSFALGVILPWFRLLGQRLHKNLPPDEFVCLLFQTQLLLWVLCELWTSRTFIKLMNSYFISWSFSWNKILGAYIMRMNTNN